jgi:hypothetical protein
MILMSLHVTRDIFWNKSNQFKCFMIPKWKSLPSEISNEEKLNACIVGLELPDIANENFEEYYAGKYNLAMGRNSVYQLTITFRDPWSIGGAEAGGNILYSYFSNYLVTSRKKYMDECSWDLSVFTTYPGNQQWRDVLIANDAMLIGVSNMSYNQSNDEISEFSVTFKFSLIGEEGNLRKVSSSK